MNSVNWPDIVLEPQWLAQLEKQALRRFVDSITAEEAAGFVLDKLAEDNWARCQTFKGQAKPSTFLFSLSARLLEEFSRQRYGRARPPVWLQQQGETWLRAWKAICLERHSPQTVIEQYSRHDKGVIQNIIRTIKARLPWCGISNLPIPEEQWLPEGESVSLLESCGGDSLEDSLAGQHLEQSLSLISALLGDEDALSDIRGEHIVTARQTLSLDDESLLMLKLHFQEGLNFSAIARALGVPNHQPGRQIKQSLQHIHAALENAGLHLRSAAQALEDNL